MAALWFSSSSLLILLLLVSWPSSSQGMTAPMQLCGSHLVDALYLVCGDRVFNSAKREVDPLLGKAGMGLSAGENEMAEGLVKRSLVEQCCLNSCNLFDLQNYCN